MSKNRKFSNLYFLEVLPEDKALVKQTFPGAKIFTGQLTEAELIKQAASAEILCPFIYSPISAKVINSLKNLKLIVTRSVGYNHLDLAAANAKNIAVCNVPDYGAHVISEFVFALLLSGLRHIARGDSRVEKEYKFYFTGLRGVALKNKTLGVIGTGKIGSNVTRIASLGFLMKVIAYDPKPNPELAEINHFKYVSLKSLLKQADIISLHCPLLPETKHFINQKSIAAMKPGVIIVNTSRGGLIDSAALTKAIKSAQVAYAFLDVLQHEDNIKQNKELIKLPQVITTPHIAFYADDSMDKMYQLSFAAIKAYLSGKKELPGRVIGL